MLPPTDRFATLPFPVRFFVREGIVLAVVVLNAAVLTTLAFPDIPDPQRTILEAIDYACMLYFVAEAILKIRYLGPAGYFRSKWNRLDFIIIVVGLPVLVGPFLHVDLQGFSVVLMLRLGRFFRFFRVMRFIPNSAQIWQGILRSLRASVGVFMVLFVINLIMAMGANLLFGHLSPEHFGNPIASFYTLFKVFTIEGWYEVPDQLVADGLSVQWGWFVRAYFILAVLTGGILGLSLANAVFVDEMTADNNDQLEAMVHDLQNEVRRVQQTLYEQQTGRLDEIQRSLQDVLQRLARRPDDSA